jgi:hypothetical protein
MVREAWEATDGGPLTADVHPEEVANYASGGWRVAEGAAADADGAAADVDEAGEDAPRRGRPRKG